MARFISPFALLALFLFCASDGHAHPHVFVDATPTLVVGEEGLAGIHHHWLFDDMFTAALLGDLGIPPETLATPQGQKAIHDGGFANLAHVGYFTVVHMDGQRVPVGSASQFKASITKDNRLIYDFFLGLDIPIFKPTNVRIAIYDREFYVDMLVLMDELGTEINGSFSSSHTVAPAPDLAYWGGFNIPQGITLALAPAGTELPAPTKNTLSAEEDMASQPSILQRGMGHIIALQKAMKKELTSLAGGIHSNPLGKEFWLFLLISFFYGGVHAVGPGHGKTVVCSYFLARPGSLWLGAVMGHAITIVHVSSATILVMGAYWLLGSGMGGFQKADHFIQHASFGLLALVGIGLCVNTLREIKNGGLIPDTSCTVDSDVVAQSEHVGSVLLVSFITGLIPCPGAAVILAFAVGLKITWTGLAAMVAMALGMGLTTTLFAWAAVSARGLALTVSGRNKKVFNTLYTLLAICGAVSIALFGLAMFFGSINIAGYSA